MAARARRRTGRAAAVAPGLMSDTPEYLCIVAPPSTQVCSKCGHTKPIEEFYPRPVPGHPQRRHRQCRSCQSKIACDRYAANREVHQARARDYAANADEAGRQRRRATNRASYARARQVQGQPYEPRLRARRDLALSVAEIRQLVREALTELDRAALFAAGYAQGSRARGATWYRDLLLAPLAAAQANLLSILSSSEQQEEPGSSAQLLHTTYDPAGSQSRPSTARRTAPTLAKPRVTGSHRRRTSRDDAAGALGATGPRPPAAVAKEQREAGSLAPVASPPAATPLAPQGNHGDRK
jgi:hypothetical protein